MITCNHDFSQSYYCIAEVIRNKKTGINNLNSTKNFALLNHLQPLIVTKRLLDKSLQ